MIICYDNNYNCCKLKIRDQRGSSLILCPIVPASHMDINLCPVCSTSSLLMTWESSGQQLKSLGPESIFLDPSSRKAQLWPLQPLQDELTDDIPYILSLPLSLLHSL